MNDAATPLLLRLLLLSFFLLSSYIHDNFHNSLMQSYSSPATPANGSFSTHTHTHTHTHTKCLPPSLFFFETYLKFEWMVMVLAGMDIAYTVSALRVAVWHGLDARDNGRWLQRTNSAGGTLVGIRIRGRVHLLLDEIISEHHTKFVYEYERIRLKSLPRRRWQ